MKQAPTLTTRIVRTPCSILLIVLSVLSLTLAPLAGWSRDLLLDTEGFVAQTAPLASDPGIQETIVTAVTSQIDSNLDVQALVGQVLPEGAAATLSGPIKLAIQSLVQKLTTQFVQSQQFRNLWETVLRTVHRQIDALLLNGSTPNGTLKLRGNELLLDLSVIVEQIKDRLVAAGIGIASKIPVIGATIVVARVNLDQVRRLQGAIRLDDLLAEWLPWIGLGLLAAAIAVAPWRRRALVAGALGVCVGMALIGIGLGIGERVVDSGLAGTAFPQGTTSTIYEALVGPLRLAVRSIFIVALIVAAIAAWVFGRSPSARNLQKLVGRGLDLLPLRSVAARVTPFASPIRIGIVVLAIIVVVLTEDVSPALLGVLAAIVVVLLGLLQLLVSVNRRVRPSS